MNSIENIRIIIPARLEIALVCIGQVGFLVKDYQGTTIVVDPYLTNYCEK